MSDAPLAEALRASIEDVLEKMFFVRGLDEFDGSAPEAGMVACVTFEGRPSGALTLRASAAAARSIAADFLGAEEGDLSDREVGEVICELANMICGSVLSKVESTTTFRLAAPRIVAQDNWAAGGERGGDIHTTAHTVGVSNGVVAVSIRMEATECQSGAERAC